MLRRSLPWPEVLLPADRRCARHYLGQPSLPPVESRQVRGPLQVDLSLPGLHRDGPLAPVESPARTADRRLDSCSLRCPDPRHPPRWEYVLFTGEYYLCIHLVARQGLPFWPLW